MSTQKTLITNAFWSLASHLFSRGTLMLAAIILARALPTPDFAAYSYFQLTVSMLGAYAALGLGTTASRYFAEVGNEVTAASPKPLGALCSISVLVSLAVGLAVFVVPASWLNANLAVPQWLMAAGVTVTALGVVPGGAILGLEQYRAATVISLLHGAVLVIATVIAARNQAPVVAMTAFVLGAFVQAAGQFAVVLRTVGWQRISEQVFFTRKDAIQIMGFAGPMFLVTLMAASGSWLVGRIILHGFEGTYNFATYSIGLHWYSLALVLPGMVSRVVLPRIVRSHDKSTEKSKEIVRYGIFLALSAAVIVSGVAVLFGPYICSIYGGNYDDLGGLFIAAFMFAALPAAPANTLGNALVADNGQYVWLGLTLLWFFCIVIVAKSALALGALSGAVAHSSAALLLSVLAFWFVRKRGLI
jgi:O-antigen/teichoic acid export membrane protein